MWSKLVLGLAVGVSGISVQNGALPTAGHVPAEEKKPTKPDSPDAFIPKCVTHLKKVTATIDHKYA